MDVSNPKGKPVAQILAEMMGLPDLSPHMPEIGGAGVIDTIEARAAPSVEYRQMTVPHDAAEWLRTRLNTLKRDLLDERQRLLREGGSVKRYASLLREIEYDINMINKVMDGQP